VPTTLAQVMAKPPGPAYMVNTWMAFRGTVTANYEADGALCPPSLIAREALHLIPYVQHGLPLAFSQTGSTLHCWPSICTTKQPQITHDEIPRAPMASRSITHTRYEETSPQAAGRHMRRQLRHQRLRLPRPGMETSPLGLGTASWQLGVGPA